MINGVKQYVDLVGKDKVANRRTSVQERNEAPADFANGKAAMLMNQNNADATLQADGMKSSAYGVVAIPAPSPLPAGGKDVASHVAGINISIFKNTKNQAAALQFVKFMTSPAEQQSWTSRSRRFRSSMAE